MKLTKDEVVKHIATENTHFIEIKDLKKKDVFFEGTALTDNIELLVLSAPKKNKRGWEIKAQDTRGKIIDIFVAHDTNFPKPDFYLVPQSIRRLELAELC